jgi:hypothetical protein
MMSPGWNCCCARGAADAEGTIVGTSDGASAGSGAVTSSFFMESESF